MSVRSQQRIRWTVAIAMMLLLIPGLPLLARQKKNTHRLRRATTHRRQRHDRTYRHYTHVSITPERVKQIQHALVAAGVLNETPNGRWDTATHDAMRQYQQQNGFSATGLPEAKPLLKLGLGPHPLPAELDPLLSTKAEGQDATEASAASSTPTAKKAVSSNP
jgi:peptidoglycan hydrolase-like protein with peptidoglycan-binding domain